MNKDIHTFHSSPDIHFEITDYICQLFLQENLSDVTHGTCVYYQVVRSLFMNNFLSVIAAERIPKVFAAPALNMCWRYAKTAVTLRKDLIRPDFFTIEDNCSTKTSCGVDSSTYGRNCGQMYHKHRRTYSQGRQNLTQMPKSINFGFKIIHFSANVCVCI